MPEPTIVPAQPARLRGVCDEIEEAEVKHLAAVGGYRTRPHSSEHEAANAPARRTGALPSSSGVTATGAKPLAGFGLEESKACFHFARGEGPQAPIVYDQQEFYVICRLFGRAAHWHIVSYHAILALKIDAVSLVRHWHIVAWAEEIVRAALIDERDSVASGGGPFLKARSISRP